MTRTDLLRLLLGTCADEAELEAEIKAELASDEEPFEENVSLTSPSPEEPAPTAPTSLTTRQLNAIDLLITGITDSQTALALGVSRQTIARWCHRNPAFIAELNFRRQSFWGANAEKLRNLASKAIEVLDEHVQEADDPMLRQRAAVHILRSAGMYGKHLQPQGEIYPEAVAQALTKTCPSSLANQ